MRKVMFFYVLVFYILFFLGCTHQPYREEGKVKRIALVIGNQDYRGNRLKNSINDAKGLSQVLERIGFDVILKFNVTLDELNKSLEHLRERVEANSTMIFIYFAGHGNTLDRDGSEEYLLMTDRERRTLVSIYKFYHFLREVESRYNIICIDACRDYRAYHQEKGTQKNFRGNLGTRTMRYGEGVKEEEGAFLDNNYPYHMPRSTIVSYAAMHHQRANDFSKYDRKHSSYAYGLMKFLDDKEIPIEEVFRRVRVSQLQESNGKQSNLEETNLEKNIWLVPKESTVAFMPPI